MPTGETQTRRSAKTFKPFPVPPIEGRGFLPVPEPERVGQVPCGRTIRLGLVDDYFMPFDCHIVDVVRKVPRHDSV